MPVNDCTWAPDRMFGIDISDACRTHDYYYANSHAFTRRDADMFFRKDIQAKGLYWTGWVYWVFVRLFGGGHYV